MNVINIDQHYSHVWWNIVVVCDINLVIYVVTHPKLPNLFFEIVEQSPTLNLESFILLKTTPNSS